LRKTALFALILLLGWLEFPASAGSSQNSGKLTLDYVLTMMDRSAEDFRSLTAALDHVKYTAVVKDTSTESGEIYVRKDSKLRIDLFHRIPGRSSATATIFTFTPRK